MACASDPQPFTGIPATYFGDVVHSAYDLFCMKDNSTGQYCTDYFASIFGDSTTDSDGTDIDTSQLCAPCIVNSFIKMQSTPYSNYDVSLADVWTTIQQRCSISHNTTVPSLQTNLTPPDYALPGSAYSAPCLSGNTYTVVGGDDCTAISAAHNVATGTLISINDILKDCSNLFIDQVLCLPQTCTTYTVQTGDTCVSIAGAHDLLYPELLAYNPSINPYCTNMAAGSLICVSPPGGATWTGTPIPSATVTQTAIYATATVAPPASIAFGTTTHCGQYYTVNSGDFCQLIALNFTIALNLFEAINPSINADCTNLIVGLSYCVFPTADWNSTDTNPTTSTTVAAPTPTPPGTTDECYQWYIVQPGDFCGLIESQFDITFAQLQFWNPSLNSDCSNLLADEAYCVNGVDQPPEGRKREYPAKPTAAPGGYPIGWPYPLRHGSGIAIDRIEL
ncbi:hypothetical protein BDN72DRAFT_840792 [Pluteus cervinus]|uniref:Uncharacterized protein n=1 Tax=Pluteus cervinus TaxID=181527 RepID=A0ACD3AU33_9AGAR|nr:hypothetical protein BDN72DRAFT_840792 [Pluteus cervinus]